MSSSSSESSGGSSTNADRELQMAKQLADATLPEARKVVAGIASLQRVKRLSTLLRGMKDVTPGMRRSRLKLLAERKQEIEGGHAPTIAPKPGRKSTFKRPYRPFAVRKGAKKNPIASN